MNSLTYQFTEIMYTFCIQKLYKMYATDAYKVYTKYIQNVLHILTNVCINFVYKSYTKVCRHVGYMEKYAKFV